MVVNPITSTLRDEPRFQDLRRRMNFPEDIVAKYLEDTPYLGEP